MGPVAERLVLAPAAGAPPVRLAGLDVGLERRLLCDVRRGHANPLRLSSIQAVTTLINPLKFHKPATVCPGCTGASGRRFRVAGRGQIPIFRSAKWNGARC